MRFTLPRPFFRISDTSTVMGVTVRFRTRAWTVSEPGHYEKRLAAARVGEGVRGSLFDRNVRCCGKGQQAVGVKLNQLPCIDSIGRYRLTDFPALRGIFDGATTTQS